jgi:two-component sensor histidine kinase
MFKRGIDRWNSIWSVGLRPGSIPAMLFALVCVAAATLMRISLGLISPDSAIFAPYYSATLVAALVSGPAAGFLAAIGGGLVAVWLFVPPQWGSTSFMAQQLVSLVLFSVSSLVIIWAAESYRGLLRRLRHEQYTRQLLNRELAHRIKNILASVQAIVRQTLRDQKDIRDDLVDRIIALGETNDLLIKSHWRTASLREILVREFAPYDLYRFDLDGPDIECPSSIAVLLALVVHEMTTNASKYGALSNTTGHISLTWRTRNNRFELEWQELGGPKPNEPSRYGFGTKLLQTGLSQFNGSAKIFFEPSGVRIALGLDFPQENHSVSLADPRHDIQAIPAVTSPSPDP